MTRRLALVVGLIGLLATTAGASGGCCQNGCDEQGSSRRPLPAGALGILDWERSVLGPRGRPAPGDDAVTERTVSRTEAARRARRAGRGATVASVSPHLALPGGGFVALSGPPPIDARELLTASSTYEPVSDDPIVRLDLTPQGQRAFATLTRGVARRAAGRPVLDDQHYAIVVAGRVVARPTAFGFDAAAGQSAERGVEIAEISRAQATAILSALND